MMFWYGGHWAIWQAGLMWGTMILFLGLLVWVGYVLITTLTRAQDRDRGRGPGAREVLDERLARGEISPEEYQRLREMIESGRAGTRHDASAGPGR